MRSLLRVLIFVVPFFSQGVFAGPVSVTYTIYVTGTVSSSMNSSVGYDGYKFTGTIPATTNVPGANTFSTTTDSTGKYNPSNFFVTGKQTVTPVS